MFVAYSALCHFHFLLKGKDFVLFTVHKPWSAMQQRRFSFLYKFNCDVCHLTGAENVVADALILLIHLLCQTPLVLLMSKVSEVSDVLEVSGLMVYSLPSPSPTASLSTFPGISYSEMSLLQQSCSKVQNLHQSSTLKIVPVTVSCSKLHCDVSTGVLHPLVPEPMKRAVFESIYKVSHPGKWASLRLISWSLVWEFLSKDVNLWAQSCISCQQNKVQNSSSPYPGSRMKILPHTFGPGWTSTPVLWFLFICLLSSIVPQDGQRQSLCSPLQQKIVCLSSYVHGSLFLKSLL